MGSPVIFIFIRAMFICYITLGSYCSELMWNIKKLLHIAADKMEISVYGIIANSTKPGALELRDRLVSLMRDRSMNCVVLNSAEEICAEERKLSMLIVIGGDGSILRYAQEASGHEIPILGVNVGRIGFLAEVASDEIETMLTSLQKKEYRIEKRMMLKCVVNNGEPHHCLNDVLVFKRSFSGVTQMTVSIDGKSLGSCFCDGMIAATPTGSTGYCLSAGGPVLVPEMSAIALTPVCSHTLHIRPTVAGPEAQILFTLEADGIVSLDGARTTKVQKGDNVSVTGSDRVARFVRFGDDNIFRLIADKLV